MEPLGQAAKAVSGMGAAVLWLFNAVISFYIWLVIAMAIMSWLTAFNVINPRNPFVQQVERFLYALTDPVLRPLRRIIPSIGGIDITPIILIFALEFLRRLVLWGVAPMLLGATV